MNPIWQPSQVHARVGAAVRVLPGRAGAGLPALAGSTTNDGLERWDAAMGECFEVADVLDYKQDNAGTEHFLVRWKGYGARGRAAARLSLVISRDYPSEWQCFGIHVQTDFVDL